MAKRVKDRAKDLKSAANSGLDVLRARALHYLLPRDTLTNLTLDEVLGRMFEREQLDYLKACYDMIGDDQKYLWGGVKFIWGDDFALYIENFDRFIPKERRFTTPVLFQPYMEAAAALLNQWQVCTNLLNNNNISEITLDAQWPAFRVLVKTSGEAHVRNPQGPREPMPGRFLSVMRDATDTIMSAALLPPVPVISLDNSPKFYLSINNTVVFAKHPFAQSPT